MITAEYKRDLKNSYLLLPAAAETAKSYQMQMISRNKIEGLLSCQLHMEKGQGVCWYEISSKQSLQHIYAASEINYEELKNLLTGIYIILQRLGQYLLHDASLLLEPEYIYMDIEERKVSLIYLPGYEESGFAGIRRLAEYVLSRVNHKEEQAARLAYHFYQCTREENFSFQHLVSYIEKQQTGGAVAQKQEAAPYRREEADKGNFSVEFEDDGEENEEYAYFQPKPAKTPDGKIMQKRLLFAAIAGTVLFAVAEVYLFLYSPGVLEKILAGGVAAVFYAGIAAAYFYSGKKQKTKHAEAAAAEEIQPFCYEEEKREEGYGNTMFFGSEIAQGRHYLEGEHKGNKLHYEIEKERVMIGKMKGKVDIVLQDTSISRLHAEIFQREEKLMLRDLHSTNGTYKNGVALQPEEIVELKSLDEIRFGRICLTYH